MGEAAKPISQVVDAAELPRNVSGIAFNQLTRGDVDKKVLPTWDIYVRNNDSINLYKRRGWFKKADDGWKFIYYVSNKQTPATYNATMQRKSEKDAQGKMWYLWNMEISECADKHPYVMNAVNEFMKNNPDGKNEKPVQEAASRNGFAPAQLVNCVVLLKDANGQVVGPAVRAGGYGFSAKHVVDEIRARNGEDPSVTVDCGTNTAKVTTFEFVEYDVAIFAWPRHASFQAVTSATHAGEVTMGELRERRKVAIVGIECKGGKRIPGSSTGVTDMYDAHNMKHRADYGTFGFGSSGSPVFVEVSPGTWHLAGIHVEADPASERNWFSIIRPEVRKRLNSANPSQM